VSGSSGIGKSTMGFQFLVAGAARQEPGLYVTLEEGPQQILATAAQLGLPLDGVERGLIDTVYVSRDRIRPNQLLALLTDRIRAGKVRRLVLDSVSHLAGEVMSDEALWQLVYALIVRFKGLDVTSVLTLESPELHAFGRLAHEHLSPLADNLIVLRYAEVGSGLQPRLTVVKTRGSEHDFDSHRISIGRGGLQILRETKPSVRRAPRRSTRR